MACIAGADAVQVSYTKSHRTLVQCHPAIAVLRTRDSPTRFAVTTNIGFTPLSSLCYELLHHNEPTRRQGCVNHTGSVIWGRRGKSGVGVRLLRRHSNRGPRWCTKPRYPRDRSVLECSVQRSWAFLSSVLATAQVFHYRACPTPLCVDRLNARYSPSIIFCFLKRTACTVSGIAAERAAFQ